MAAHMNDDDDKDKQKKKNPNILPADQALPLIERLLSAWNDAGTLRHYRTVISEIRRETESQLPLVEWVSNGFKDWPTPNPYCHRTRAGILVEVSYLGHQIVPHSINRLLTPFGEVEIFGSGLSESIQKIARYLVDWMRLSGKLLDVTEGLERQYLNLYGEKKFIARMGPYPRTSWEGAGDRVHVYLLHVDPSRPEASTVNIDPDLDPIHLFESVNGGQDDYYTRSKQMFTVVTDGRDQF